ncbi:MAG: fadE, partial [Actinomycetia bacterium]|nr:fadE [Actinomycetes bacterium]
IASAVLDRLGDDDVRARYLPSLAGGELVAGVGLGADVTVAADGAHRGVAPAVLGAGTADLVLLVSGEDVLVLDPRAAGVVLDVPPNLDLSRRSGTVRLEGVPAEEVLRIVGGRRVAEATFRLLLAAEAAGGAHDAVESAVAYAKARSQFGRTIGTFQAIKHHCANMLVDAERATAAVWDAARAGTEPDEQLELAGAIAAAEALPAYVRCAQLNLQVHGGIGFTWEHDAHLLLRRATALAALGDPGAAAVDVTRLAVGGVTRTHEIELPPEAEAFRARARAVAREVAALDGVAARDRLIETGYLQAHWPAPWGLAAGAVEQLVIDEELHREGVELPDLGITGWVILTLLQHGTDDQRDRWVGPALRGDVVWCQLFSEPDAGSDAAGIRAAARRTTGGWLVTGQKVWTSDAQRCALGLATVRTNPDVKKHAGISTFVIDMKAAGVDVRPLREITGEAMFNEVFFDDVFVPDDDVVGPVDGGWAVARSTLGNERVSIGSGSGGITDWVDLADLHRRFGLARDGAARDVGLLLAERQAIRALELRRATRAVAGGEPGPEGNITKLVSAEHAQRATELGLELLGAAGVTLAGELATHVARSLLLSRAMTIAGGTSEITRNQIGERVLGLPRDPLLS